MTAVSAAIAELAKVSGGDEIPSPAAQREFLGYLSKLHVSDPASYCELMRGVCNGIKEGAFTCDNGTKEDRTSKVIVPQEICPRACFAIKTYCTPANNLGCATNTIVTKNGGVKGVYINVVCSKAISAPELPNGKQPTTMEELLSVHCTSGVQIQIPLLIGSMRTIDKPNERAIDMLVYTFAAEAAVKDYKSKMHLIELGLQWVENETGVKVLREWEDICNGQIYIGGQGKDGSIPLPYPIHSRSDGNKEWNNVKRYSQKNAAVGGGGVTSSMNDPIDLLSAMRQQQRHTADADNRVKSKEMLLTAQGHLSSADRRNGGRGYNFVDNDDSDEVEGNAVAKKKNPLITEVVKKQNVSSPCGMKKGFLVNRTQKNEQFLYPEGGSNEHNNPNAYSTIMSRCKVIDTGNMTELKKEKKKVELSPPAAEYYDAITDSRSSSKQHENTRKKDVKISHAQMDGRTNVQLDSLLSIADPGIEMEENEDTEEDLIGEQLSTLAKLLCGSTSMVPNSLDEKLPCGGGDNKKKVINTAHQPPVEQVQHDEQAELQNALVERALPPGVQQRDELPLIEELQKEQKQPQDEDHQPSQPNYSLTTKGTEACLRISNIPMEALDNPKAITVNASRAAIQVFVPAYEKHIQICDFPFEIDANRVKVKVKVSKRELTVHIVERAKQ